MKKYLALKSNYDTFLSIPFEARAKLTPRLISLLVKYLVKESGLLSIAVLILHKALEAAPKAVIFPFIYAVAIFMPIHSPY